jgi:hypothetical protein
LGIDYVQLFAFPSCCHPIGEQKAFKLASLNRILGEQNLKIIPVHQLNAENLGLLPGSAVEALISGGYH